jgi:hypothetical protein
MGVNDFADGVEYLLVVQRRHLIELFAARSSALRSMTAPVYATAKIREPLFSTPPM